MHAYQLRCERLACVDLSELHRRRCQPNRPCDRRSVYQRPRRALSAVDGPPLSLPIGVTTGTRAGGADLTAIVTIALATGAIGCLRSSAEHSVGSFSGTDRCRGRVRLGCIRPSIAAEWAALAVRSRSIESARCNRGLLRCRRPHPRPRRLTLAIAVLGATEAARRSCTWMRASARLRRHYQHCKLRASGALGSLRTFDEPPMTGLCAS